MPLKACWKDHEPDNTVVPVFMWRLIWAASWQNQQNGMCALWRLRSAWAPAQSDQSLLSAWRKIGSLATHWVHCADWADAQVDLSLRWAHSHFVGFVMRCFIWLFLRKNWGMILLEIIIWGGKSVGFMVRNFSFVGPTLERVWFDVHYSTQHGAKKKNFQAASNKEIIELPHDKTNKITVRPAKIRNSLGICPVWSESSVCTQWELLKVSSCGQQRLWSDLAYAQADLSLCWAHMPFCCFCHEAAQILYHVLSCFWLVGWH